MNLINNLELVVRAKLTMYVKLHQKEGAKTTNDLQLFNPLDKNPQKRGKFIKITRTSTKF